MFQGPLVNVRGAVLLEKFLLSINWSFSVFRNWATMTSSILFDLQRTSSSNWWTSKKRIQVEGIQKAVYYEGLLTYRKRWRAGKSMPKIGCNICCVITQHLQVLIEKLTKAVKLLLIIEVYIQTHLVLFQISQKKKICNHKNSFSRQESYCSYEKT